MVLCDLECVCGGTHTDRPFTLHGTHVHVHVSTTAEFLIYDDACHLKKYACNPVRCDKTPTAQRMASLRTVVDKFHFVGHVDPWCQEHCNPYKFKSLEKVSVSHVAYSVSKIYIDARSFSNSIHST